MVTLLLVVLSVCVSVMFLQFRLDFGWLIDWLLVFNATFSNISAISWIRFWNCSDSVVFKKTLILLIRAVVVVIIWIYNYLCNQCLSPRKLWVRSSLMARCTTDVMKSVSDLRQVGGFLRVIRFPPIKLPATI